MQQILFQRISFWRRSPSRLVVALVLLALLTGACSSGQSDEGAEDVDRPLDNAGDGEDSNDTDEDEPGELAFSADERILEEVRLGLVEPQSFRPDEVLLTDQSAVIIADLLYDGLTEAGEDEQLRPALAAEWSTNDDFTEWTFLLADDAGVTADDVANSFEGVLLGDTTGTVGAVMATVEAVEAFDDRTVVIELFEPNAGLAWMVSGLPFSVVGPGGATTGRYELAEENDDGLALRPVAGQRLPEINVIWSETAEEAYDLLTLGVVDAAVADVASIEDADLRFGADLPARSITRFYVVNGIAPGLETPEARRALLGVLDGEALVASDPTRSIVEIDGLVPESVTGYRADVCGAECQFDFDAAAVLDRPVRVGYFGREQRLISEALVGQLVAAGYEAEAVELEASELADEIVDGTLDLFSFGWIAPATTVDAVLPLLLAPSSPTGVVGVESVSIVALLDAAATTEADQQRWDLLAEAHAEALAQGRIVPLTADTSVLVRAPHAEIVTVRADGSIDLAGLQP